VTSFLKTLTVAALVVLGFRSGAHAVVGSLWPDYNLSGIQTTTTWLNLSNTNMTLAPTSGAGTVIVNSPGFQASIGLYSFSADYSIETASALFAGDIKNVVFQLDWSPNPDLPLVAPTLSYNNGTQNIAATFSAINGSEPRNTFMGSMSFSGYAWQWDLSGISDDITSVSIFSPVSVHTSVMGAELQLGDTFVQVVPEPAAGTLIVAALGGLWLRRRRNS